MSFNPAALSTDDLRAELARCQALLDQRHAETPVTGTADPTAWLVERVRELEAELAGRG